ncbi:MAG: prephenate dehydratase [Oscillospiraceae bacterium]
MTGPASAWLPGVEGAIPDCVRAAVCSPKRYTKRFAMVRAVMNGEVEFGVLPIQNSSAGCVDELFGLLLQYNPYICRSLKVEIRHALLARPEVESLAELEQVISHEQALAQCAGYLEKHGLAAEAVRNTAVAARMVADEKQRKLAAICSEENAARYGLRVLEREIQDFDYNFTQFLCICKRPLILPDSRTISLSFSVANEVGSLHRVLTTFAVNGMNLTKIESSPIPGTDFEYQFTLDVQGNLRDEKTRAVICALSDHAKFSVLGIIRICFSWTYSTGVMYFRHHAHDAKTVQEVLLHLVGAVEMLVD